MLPGNHITVAGLRSWHTGSSPGSHGNMILIPRTRISSPGCHACCTVPGRHGNHVPRQTRSQPCRTVLVVILACDSFMRLYTALLRLVHAAVYGGPCFAGRAAEHAREGGWVHVLLLVGLEGDCPVDRQWHDATPVIGDPAQRHERAQLTGAGAPVPGIALEDDRARDASPQPQRRYEPPIRGKLAEPCGRQVPRADRGYHPVVGCPVRMSERAVTEDDTHIPVTRRRKARPGAIRDVFVHVDRG